jgi:hypothetical protein
MNTILSETGLRLKEESFFKVWWHQPLCLFIFYIFSYNTFTHTSIRRGSTLGGANLTIFLSKLSCPQFWLLFSNRADQFRTHIID